MYYYLTYILIGLYFSFPALGNMSYNIENYLRLPSEVVESIKVSDQGLEKENKSSKKTNFKAGHYSSYYNSLFSASSRTIFNSDFRTSQTEYFSFQTKLKETYLSKMLC
jgi:hypothetical protein